MGRIRRLVVTTGGASSADRSLAEEVAAALDDKRVSLVPLLILRFIPAASLVLPFDGLGSAAAKALPLPFFDRG
jgi:hypothetical protein